jgi:hypothetical protein
MYVFMYVCTYVPMHVSIYVCMRVCTYVSMYACMHTYIHMSYVTHAHIHIWHTTHTTIAVHTNNHTHRKTDRQKTPKKTKTKSPWLVALLVSSDFPGESSSLAPKSGLGSSFTDLAPYAACAWRISANAPRMSPCTVCMYMYVYVCMCMYMYVCMYVCM